MLSQKSYFSFLSRGRSSRQPEPQPKWSLSSQPGANVDLCALKHQIKLNQSRESPCSLAFPSSLDRFGQKVLLLVCTRKYLNQAHSV